MRSARVFKPLFTVVEWVGSPLVAHVVDDHRGDVADDDLNDEIPF